MDLFSVTRNKEEILKQEIKPKPTCVIYNMEKKQRIHTKLVFWVIFIK